MLANAPASPRGGAHDAPRAGAHDALRVAVPDDVPDGPALKVVRASARAGEIVHVEHIPGRGGSTANWPDSVRPEVAAALAAHGVRYPWAHQAQAAALAGGGRDVIIATRAASGKSAGYLAAALSEVVGGGTALYISPTKALAADQVRLGRERWGPGGPAACPGGATPAAPGPARRAPASLA